MASITRKYYAVIRGRRPGIYERWGGSQGAEIQVRGFPGAVFKGFVTLAEARQAMESGTLPRLMERSGRRSPRGRTGTADREMVDLTEGEATIRLYTDGGCHRNPGPGGWGVVLVAGEARREASGGFRLTTNNRMELYACIHGLAMLTEGTHLTLYSDSRYVINALALGWARRWRERGWRRADGPALNPDLWERLLSLFEKRQVELVWVKGHAGNTENERCDRLAGEALRLGDLPADEQYEGGALPPG